MQIKGSAVRTILDFVKTKFPEKLDEWLSRLPSSVSSIYKGSIRPSDWYPLHDAAIIPTEILSEIAFNGDIKKASRECGRFSAESSLRGIYRFFLMATPSRMVVSTGGRILATFYNPVDFKLVESGSEGAKIHITRIEDTNGVIENRIAGWIERALEIQGLKASQVDITQSLTKGDPVTEITIVWK
ncbi:MAG: hypothetical protein JXR41_06300 [Bacteroidales bacterium]|nr:hypothetical protein [Bacteroidales bacterium]MBN2762682.1 hypothetical protein [Bacteroidales bacterium]